MDWREHPLLALAGIILILLLSVFVVVRGCGCHSRTAVPAPSDDKKAGTAQATKTGTGKPKKVWMDDCAEPVWWNKEGEAPKAGAAKPAAKAPAASLPTPAAPAAPSGNGGGGEGDRGPPPVTRDSFRPVDLGRWSPEDFQAAQRENDPRLIAAVAYLGKHFATPEGAEFLAKLLAPSSAEAAARRAPPSPALVEAVVAALMANGTTAARQILERFLAGTQETVEPQLVAAATLKALLQRPGTESEDLLFRVIVAAETPMAAARAAIDSNQLRATALEWVKSSASEAFRIRLANALAGAEVPPTTFSQVWAVLSEARPENLAAQIVLYRGDRLAEPERQSLERQFAELSRGELRQLLGCAAQSPRPAADAAGASSGLRRPAELLWTPQFARLVMTQLRAAESAERASQLLSLAATIPCTAMRAIVLQSMEQYWEEGPRRVESLAAGEDSLPEPGFLLLVKQLPRKSGSAASSPGGGEGAEAPRPAARNAKIAAARQARDRQDRITQQWLAFSEKMLQVMCRQFRAAAYRHVDSDEAPPDFALKLPPGTEVAAAHWAQWPAGLHGTLARLELPPLRVDYLRIERKARPDKVVAYFRRQLPTAVRHLNDHGVWLDDFSMDRKKGNSRSVDVFVEKPNKDVGIVLDQEQQVIIEMLIVEARSPAEPVADLSIPRLEEAGGRTRFSPEDLAARTTIRAKASSVPFPPIEPLRCRLTTEVTNADGR